MFVNLIVWIIFGALAGWIATLVIETDEHQNGLLNIVIGILGALLGGLLVRAIGGMGLSGIQVNSLLIAVFGSVIMLMIITSLVRS